MSTLLRTDRKTTLDGTPLTYKQLYYQHFVHQLLVPVATEGWQTEIQHILCHGVEAETRDLGQARALPAETIISAQGVRGELLAQGKRKYNNDEAKAQIYVKLVREHPLEFRPQLEAAATVAEDNKRIRKAHYARRWQSIEDTLLRFLDHE